MTLHIHDLPDSTRLLIDGLSLSIVLGTLIDTLLAIASLLAIIWWSISIYEKPTVQRWRGRVVQVTGPH